MRKCPYCAEQIQDAAVLCRFCGKDVQPLAAPSSGVRPGLPSQRWYDVDERIKDVRRSLEPQRKPSLWAKLGGLASTVLEPRTSKPNRTGRTERLVRHYPSLREYQIDVAKLTNAGWLIERQSGGADGNGAVTVTWIREPAAS